MTDTAQNDLLTLARQGDREACDRFVSENSGLIWSIVRRFLGRGVDPDDLFQIGCVGFLKALSGYDPAFGTKFSTYAVPKITGEILRFLRDDGSIKVSRTIKEHASTIRSARARLEQKLGREPVLSELAAETGLTPEDIAAAETATGSPESLQRESEDGFTLEHILSDNYQEDTLIEHVALREAVRSLPEKERSVIILRFFRGLTQDKTAKILGVSQVQVSRIEKRGITALRRLLE